MNGSFVDDDGVLEAKKKAINFLIMLLFGMCNLMSTQIILFYGDEPNLDKAYIMREMSKIVGWVAIGVALVKQARFINNYKNKKNYFGKVFVTVSLAIFPCIIILLAFNLEDMYIIFYNVLVNNVLGAFIIEVMLIILEEYFWSGIVVLIIFFVSLGYVMELIVRCIKFKRDKIDSKFITSSKNYIGYATDESAKKVCIFQIIMFTLSGVALSLLIGFSNRGQYIDETDFLNYASNHSSYYRFDDEWIIGKSFKEIADRYPEIHEDYRYFKEYYYLEDVNGNEINYITTEIMNGIENNEINIYEMRYSVYCDDKNRASYNISFDEEGKAVDIHKELDEIWYQGNVSKKDKKF